MKALTIYPDWMMLYMSGEKTAEFRTWQTKYRGDILLCSGAKRIPGCISGHALMIGNLVDIVPLKKEHLDLICFDSMPEEKGYAWLFDNLRYIEPFEVRGKMGLFDVEASPNVFPVDASDKEGAVFFERFIYPLIFEPVQK